MKFNKELITLIIGLLSYLYLLININKKLYFVFLYLLFLLFGFYFIGNNIFLYAPLIIIIEIFKTQYYIEGNTMNTMLEEQEENNNENDNENNYDVIDYTSEEEDDLEDSDVEDELTDTIIGDDV
tara:strand:- start:579 stop:953 length:375 start_codon:yes stop_codon:yes gene_type:complete